MQQANETAGERARDGESGGAAAWADAVGQGETILATPRRQQIRAELRESEPKPSFGVLYSLYRL